MQSQALDCSIFYEKGTKLAKRLYLTIIFLCCSLIFERRFCSCTYKASNSGNVGTFSGSDTSRYADDL